MCAHGLLRFCQHHWGFADGDTTAEPAIADEVTEGTAPDDAVTDGSRRDFLLGGAGAVGGAAALLAAGGIASEAHAQAAVTAPRLDGSQIETETPIGPKWWPSRWGSDDEAGASNWITPDKVLDAVKLIRSGRIYEMGRVADQRMPLYGERGFLLRTVGSPTGGPLGDNKVVWNDEFLATEIGQVGSCMDGLGHIGCQVGDNGDLAAMRFYNGLTLAEIAGPYGLRKLGIEKVKPFFTRGMLIDVAGLKGRALAKGEEITLADVRASLAAQGIDEVSLQPGDAVFFNTGWGSLWNTDPEKYSDGEPGIGMEVARWIVEKQACLTGCDNWGCEVVPNPHGRLAFPAHQELIAKHGIFIFEGLNFEPLMADRVWRFAFILTPLMIKGATGSIARPIAIS